MKSEKEIRAEIEKTKKYLVEQTASHHFMPWDLAEQVERLEGLNSAIVTLQWVLKKDEPKEDPGD